ncbi:putative transcriptional regulator, TetR family [Smithella sp. ME-1]|uniref:Transcriptional regulator, tetr family n=1 Tax=hydrocarbon metagenome TaxID=938273 RepID=A0A0W8FLU8_9ZZZZ|nr:putative transcriptional regulator, TetR family [Smithella sp. ME-1]
MPRTSRTPEQIDAFRQKILDAALFLIIEHGFSELSMRKIASRLSVTATTIYNYYASREELYFFIRIKGFELLYESQVKAYEAHDNPYDIFCAVIEEYLRFGTLYPDYYEVMFTNRGVPKFLDCIGTPLEQVAGREKETSIQPFLFTARKIAEHLNISETEARYLTIKLWTELNGIVSLLNSRLLREVEENTNDLVKRLIADICERYHQLIIEKSFKKNSSQKGGTDNAKSQRMRG